jgi:site-specific DNA-methyltransferase (adenine-specific)
MNSQRGKHSTQKPVSLMEWILKYYSREGGIVLDPTMGSGSMGSACKNMDRYFIGFEKDEKIFSIAMERLTD